jgi:hypothetical protein
MSADQPRACRLGYALGILGVDARTRFISTVLADEIDDPLDHRAAVPRMDFLQAGETNQIIPPGYIRKLGFRFHLRFDLPSKRMRAFAPGH